MLKIDRNSKNLTRLQTPTLAESSITERYDLQECIANSPTEFFAEMGEELFLVGTEIMPSKDVQDRIDLLTIDREGKVVVIELKRGSNKLQMLQAISYAGMFGQWDPEDFLTRLDEQQQEELESFLDCDTEQINSAQRVILVAESFDFALLMGTQWLCEEYGVDIICCRIAMATDTDGQSEYLACSTVYPPKELVEEARKRGKGKRGARPDKWSDWDVALANISNQDLVAYYKQRLEDNHESYLKKRILRYRLHGKRRWFVAARQKQAYVWQQGRFDGDIEFWQGKISQTDSVTPVKDGKCLRMFLKTAGDFTAFHDGATNELQTVSWLEVRDEQSPDDEG